MQRFLDLFISINCSTCFRRFLRLPSGAQKCTIYFYKLLNMFQAVPPPIIRSTKLYIQRQVLPYWRMAPTPHQASSISSTIAASNSIGLTIPDAVCTVLCSWWWAEELPETCRAIYRYKQIEKTLHLVGCTLEMYLRCRDRCDCQMSVCVLISIFWAWEHNMQFDSRP